MPRRKRVFRKTKYIDPVYKSDVVGKFVNYLMLDGKKSTALGIFYDSMDIIKKKTKEDPFKVFDKAVNNVKPIVEVRSRRIGGATYQVPMEIRADRKLALAIRWILNAAKSRSGKSMADKLANELVAAYNKENSAAIKKREDTHRMAEANKAYANFRW